MTHAETLGARYARLFRSGFVYAIGNTINRVSGLVLLPVYTRVIPPSELGILWILLSASGILTTLIGLGLNSAIFRSHFQAEDDEAKRRVVSSALLLLLVLSACILPPLLLLRAPLAAWIAGSPAYGRHVAVALFAVFLEILLLVPLALLRVRERAARFSALATGRLLVSVGLNTYLVVHRDLGVYGVLLGNALANAAAFLVLLPGLARDLAPHVDRAAVRSMVRFGAPIMVASLGAILLDSADVWILRAFRGVEEVSAYGLVYRITRIMNVVVVQPFIFAWPSLVWSIERDAAAPRVFARTLTYLIALAGFVALAMGLFRRELTLVFGPREYLHASSALPWVAFGLVFAAAQSVLNTGASLTGRTERITIAVFVAVAVNLGLNLVLIPRHGFLGAAYATFAAYLVQATVSWFLGQRLRPMPYEWRRIATVLGLAAVCLVVAETTDRGLGPGAFGMRILLALGYVAACVSPLVLRREERVALRSIWKRPPLR